jgi:hypothetical protein
VNPSARASFRTAELAAIGAAVALCAAFAHITQRGPRADEHCGGEITLASHEGDVAAITALPRLVRTSPDVAWRPEQLHFGSITVDPRNHVLEVGDEWLCPGERLTLRYGRLTQPPIRIHFDAAEGIFYVVSDEHTPEVLGAFRRHLAERRIAGITDREGLEWGAVGLAIFFLGASLLRLRRAAVYCARRGLVSFRAAQLDRDGWIRGLGGDVAYRGLDDLPTGPVLVGPDAAAVARVGVLAEPRGETAARRGYRGGAGARVRVVAGTRAEHREAAERAADGAGATAHAALVLVALALVAGVVPLPFRRPAPRSDAELPTVASVPEPRQGP